MNKKKDFKQIYLRDNNISPKLKENVVYVMSQCSIATATNALIYIGEAYSDLKEEIKNLQKKNIEKDKKINQLNKQINDSLKTIESLRKSVNSYFALKNKLADLEISLIDSINDKPKN